MNLKPPAPAMLKLQALVDVKDLEKVKSEIILVLESNNCQACDFTVVDSYTKNGLRVSQGQAM